MKAKPPKPGDVVECVFLDHVEDGTDPIKFTVWGRLEKITRTKLVIASWAYEDGEAREDGNEKRWTIVRSAVCSLHKLQRTENA